MRTLTRIDQNWIPPDEGSALYLRPFMIATDAALGMSPSGDYLYCVVASPVGSGLLIKLAVNHYLTTMLAGLPEAVIEALEARTEARTEEIARSVRRAS